MKEPTYSSIKDIRKALRMSSKHLAKKIEKAPSTLSELESRERTGKITIGILQEIAGNLGFELKYEFVPKNPIADVLLQQAIKQVKSELGADHHHFTDDDLKADAAELLSKYKCLNWNI